MARQLAECAPWGGMLVSEDIWQEQGPHINLWVYQESLRMPWGPVIACYMLPPEGHLAYLHFHALPSRVTRGMLLLQALVLMTLWW